MMIYWPLAQAYTLEITPTLQGIFSQLELHPFSMMQLNILQHYLRFEDEVQNGTSGFKWGLGQRDWLSQKAPVNNLQLIES